MSESFSKSFLHTADGTMWNFMAEALVAPTGLILTAYLTRNLGPEGYGLFALAFTLISWATWSISSLFSRTAIKLVSEAEDWRPVGATVLRLYFVCGLGTMLLFWFGAEFMAGLLGEPKLKLYLQLFSLEPLFFILARAHSFILIGRGDYRRQAIPIAIRLVARMALIVSLVEMGFSVTGAVLGSVGAALAELAICRFYARPSLFHRSAFPAKELWSYATPLFLSAISMQLLGKVDLFALSAMGGTLAEAGIYGAAQSMSIIPTIFSASFAPLLLSSLGRMIKEGQDIDTRAMARNSMRAVIGILPFAGMAAGSAREVVVFVFGSAFSPTAPLLALLIFAKVSIVMISVASVLMISANKPQWTFSLAGPMLLLALGGHALLIPKMGALGAASVTTAVSFIGGCISVACVYRLWQVLPQTSTILRSILLTALAYFAAISFPTQGFWLISKLLVITIAIPVCFEFLGEFSHKEIELARTVLRRRSFLKKN